MPSLHGATEVATRESRVLAPIRIFTDLIELTGRVAPAGQRITDILLRGQDLAFLPAGAAPEPENWILIAPTDILFVSPPPMAPRAPWRARRDQRAVALCVGRYRVRGTAHLAPGVEPAQLPSRPGFLPLTDARVDEERFSVVIVNLARAVIDPRG
jgi:hypothetical protein